MKRIFTITFLFLIIIGLNAQTFKHNYTYDTTVIGAFHQGSNYDYNCASIALIKCAIATFGINNVFKSKIENANDYTIILLNEDTVSLSKQELDSATRRSGFVKDDNQAIFNQANFIYAVMAKRAVKFSGDDYSFSNCTDFDEALAVFHNGFTVTYLPALLGLGQVKVKHKRELSYIFANGYHAVFASKKVFDNYGSPDELTLKNWLPHLGKNPIRDIESVNFKLIDIKKKH